MTSDAHAVLHDAVLALCRDGDLVTRLARAHAVLSTLDSSGELPDNLWFRFEELLADLAYGADAVPEALSLMSAPDRDRLADRIVALHGELARRVPADA